MGKLRRFLGGGQGGASAPAQGGASTAAQAAPPADAGLDNSVAQAALPDVSAQDTLLDTPFLDRVAGSTTDLRLEKAGLYAKKYGAKAVDSLLFAPMHMIDQLSIADVHAVDGLNFLASGQTRRQRAKSDTDDPIAYEGSGLYKENMSTAKGRPKAREMGRTGLREFASTGTFMPSAVASLDSSKPFHHQMWGWGEDTLGFNPARELRRTALDRASAPETPDNQRITALKEELAARKAEKKNKGGGG